MLRSYWLTSIEELADIEYDWEHLRLECKGSIFTSYCLSTLWLKAYRDIRPRVLVVKDGPDLVGIAPLALIEEKANEAPLRTLTYIAGGRKGKLRYNHMCILCKPGKTDVLTSIIKEMRKAGSDSVQLRFMPDSTATREFVSRMQSVSSLEYYSAWPTITCSIPPAGDVMANFGKKTRDNLRYKMRRLEKDERVELRSVSVDGTEESVGIYVQQHIERWKDKNGSMFENPENVAFLKLLVKTSIAKGFGFMNELLIDGRVAAQDFGFFDDELVRLYRGGMDIGFAAHSPGIIVTCYEMETFRQKGISAINFGRGREEYKMHMGGEESSLIGIRYGGGIARISNLAQSTSMRLLKAIRAYNFQL
jgi:CelD/BcsL family acetyltransferase involved in cellulose biosynthesis